MIRGVTIAVRCTGSSCVVGFMNLMVMFAFVEYHDVDPSVFGNGGFDLATYLIRNGGDNFLLVD